MARNRRKKALYEVIGKTWPKSGQGKRLEQLHLESPGEDRPAASPPVPVSERPIQWPRRAKIVQFNADRIEFSVPYQIAIALLLGLVLLALVAFRLGQFASISRQEAAEAAVKTPETMQKATSEITFAAPKASILAEKIPLNARKAKPAKPTGNNRIVVQTYQLRAHLEPVKLYFARFGIETEIRKIGDWYYLVTSNSYENPEKPGTDGHSAKQRIIELGARYKAPPGYETFGSRPFHDAYGMRLDD